MAHVWDFGGQKIIHAKHTFFLTERALYKDAPDRKWYSVSAEGLMEAATWVKDFSAKIGGTLKDLGSLIIPGFELPNPEK